MDTTNSLIIILIFIVYSTISFLLFDINLNFIMNYIFSIIITLVVLIVRNNFLSIGFDFNNYPTIMISYIFLILQFVISLMILFINLDLNLNIIIEIILLAIFLILNILLLKSKKYIENNKV